MTEAQKERAEELSRKLISPPETYGEMGQICYPWIINAFKSGYSEAVRDADRILVEALVKMPKEVDVKGRCKVLSVGWGNCGCNMCAVETFAQQALKQWREGLK